MIRDARVLQDDFIPTEVKHRDPEVNRISDALAPCVSRGRQSTAARPISQSVSTAEMPRKSQSHDGSAKSDHTTHLADAAGATPNTPRSRHGMADPDTDHDHDDDRTYLRVQPAAEPLSVTTAVRWTKRLHDLGDDGGGFLGLGGTDPSAVECCLATRGADDGVLPHDHGPGRHRPGPARTARTRLRDGVPAGLPDRPCRLAPRRRPRYRPGGDGGARATGGCRPHERLADAAHAVRGAGRREPDDH